jgi:starvation-inducible outer membrane lipoprotein
MAGVVNIPWYATLFRGDQFETALKEIAPVALRYGASDYEVMRSNDDRYRFWQFAHFELYYYGPEFNDWRADYSSYYQVPVVYSWFDRVVAGEITANHAPAA